MRAIFATPRLLALVAGTFLLFFRPFHGMSTELWSGYDDACYVEWLHRMMGLGYPYCQSKSYLPGVALFWLPAGWVARFLPGGFYRWLPMTLGLASFGAWGMGLVLLGDALFILNIPALHYAVARTTMSHAVECGLACALAAALLHERRYVALFFALWLSLTRPNDAPALLVVLGAFLDARDARGITLVGILTAIVGVTLIAIGFSGSYHGTTLPMLMNGLLRGRGVWWKITEPNWGWLWTAPLFLLIAIAGTAQIGRLTWRARGALAWLLFNFFICGAWWGHGHDFSHRYLIGASVGAYLVWCELALPRVCLLPGAVWMTYLTWIYETRWADPYWFGREALVPFQIMALRLLSHPERLVRPLGLSAPGVAFFSWFHDRLPGYADWRGWTGPRLYALTLVVAIAVVSLSLFAAKVAAATESES